MTIKILLQYLYVVFLLTSTLSCTNNTDANSKIDKSSKTKFDHHLLTVNFEDIDRGGASEVRYTAAKLEADFNWDMLGYSSKNGGNTYFGPLEATGSLQSDSVWIVPDPAGNTGRGNVLRVTHLPKAWGGNSGADTVEGSGAGWRIDFTPVDEVYFAYDIYLSPGEWYALQEKLPGVIAGTKLEASHPGDRAPSVDDPWRGVTTFTHSMQLFSDQGYGRGNGSLGTYYYDNDRVQRSDWLNTLDPTSQDENGQYLLPRGVWVTIEQHVKMNTADNDPAYNKNVDLKDGLSEVYINGVLMSRKYHSWRKWQNLKADGVWVYNIYGGNGGNARNIPAKTEYTYFDNFIISTSPVSH